MMPTGCGFSRALVICLSFLATPLLFIQGEAIAGDGFSIDARQIQLETVGVLQELEENAKGAGQRIILGTDDTILPSAANALRMSWISLEAVIIRDAFYKSLEFGLDRVLDLLGFGGRKKTKAILKAIKYALTSSDEDEFIEKLGVDAADELGKKLGISGEKRKVFKKLYKKLRGVMIPKIKETGTTTHYKHPNCGRVSINIWGGMSREGVLLFRVSISGNCEGRYTGEYINGPKLGAFMVYGDMPADLDVKGTEEKPKLVVRIVRAGSFLVSAPYPYKKEEKAPKAEPVEPDQPSYVPPISERICLRRCDDAYAAADQRYFHWSKVRDALKAAKGRSTEARKASDMAQGVLDRQKRELTRAENEVQSLKLALATNQELLAEKERKYKQMPPNTNSASKLYRDIRKLDKQISAIKGDKIPQANKNIRRITGIIQDDTKRLEELKKFATTKSQAVKKLQPGYYLVSDANEDGQAGYGKCMRRCLAQDPKGGPWVKLDETKVRPEATLSISYRTLWGYRDVAGRKVGPWLGIFPEGKPELSGAVADKVMVSEKRHFVPERDVDETALKTQLTAPEKGGDYEVRLYSGTVLVSSFMAAKAKFTVRPASKLKARYRDLPPETLEVR